MRHPLAERRHEPQPVMSSALGIAFAGTLATRESPAGFFAGGVRMGDLSALLFPLLTASAACGGICGLPAANFSGGVEVGLAGADFWQMRRRPARGVGVEM